MPATPLLSWLHLSDIHFAHGNASEREEQRLVLAQLADDILRAPSYGAPSPDLILVAGDIAYSGDTLGRNEYDAARTWLRQLAARLRIPASKVHLVPGNHDVVRVKADAPFWPELCALRKGTRSVDEALALEASGRALTARLSKYLEAAREFGLAAPETAASQGGSCWRHDLQTPLGLKVRLQGFNTALLANGDDRGELRFGLEQLAFARPEGPVPDLGIALFHHPLDWLGDRAQAEPRLQQQANLWLCGHMHGQKAIESLDSGGRMLVRVQAGAVHDRPEAGQPASALARFSYNFGAIQLRRGKLELDWWPFALTSRREFGPDESNLSLRARRRNYESIPLGIPFKPSAGRTPAPGTGRVRASAAARPRKAPRSPALGRPQRYRPPLAVYVVWHPKFAQGSAWSERLYTWLTRDGQRALARTVGIPVFFRSVPEARVPRPIALEDAEQTAVVVLVDSHLLLATQTEPDGWGRYLGELCKEADASGIHRVFPVAFNQRSLALRHLDERHFIRLDQQPEGEQALYLSAVLKHELCRLLLKRPRRSEATGEALDSETPPVRLFLSHTKLTQDAGKAIALQLRAFIQDRLSLRTFFDSMDIPPGRSFADVLLAQFEPRAHSEQHLTALIAIQTDGYGGRAWCQREVLWAKRYGCPIVVVNAVQQGEDRAFPYLGNAPTHRWKDDRESCRATLDLALGEVLRFSFLKRQLDALVAHYGRFDAATTTVMARSPELLTLMPSVKTCLYPDPPMSEPELELMQERNEQMRFLTPLQLLSERIAGDLT